MLSNEQLPSLCSAFQDKLSPVQGFIWSQVIINNLMCCDAVTTVHIQLQTLSNKTNVPTLLQPPRERLFGPPQCTRRAEFSTSEDFFQFQCCHGDAFVSVTISSSKFHIKKTHFCTCDQWRGHGGTGTVVGGDVPAGFLRLLLSFCLWLLVAGLQSTMWSVLLSPSISTADLHWVCVTVRSSVTSEPIHSHVKHTWHLI